MPSRMRVIRPSGQGSAVSRAAASPAIRSACSGSAISSIASQPAQSWWRPKLLGWLRVCTSSSLVAVASMPPPDSTMVCSSRAPSLLARSRCSRTNSSELSRTVTRGTRAIAASAASSTSILRSSETAKGSTATGVRYSPVAGVSGASRTGALRSRAPARAMRTARRTASSAPRASMRSSPAKPQAPSTITRTPTPSSS